MYQDFVALKPDFDLFGCRNVSHGVHDAGLARKSFHPEGVGSKHHGLFGKRGGCEYENTQKK